VSEPWRTILVVLAGLGTGVLSGMFGVGGAVVSTPAIRGLGATPVESVGSTLPSILPSAISGALRYQREHLVLWRVALWTSASGILGSVTGALLVDVIPGDGHLLMIATALLLAYTAARTGRSPARPDPSDAEPPEGGPDVDPGERGELAVAAPAALRTTPARMMTTGAVAGLLSGLLGIGGGIVMVPAFSGWMRMNIKQAVGTSLVCVGILAVPGTITHQLLGHINWAFAGPLCIAVIPGARLGAHLAIVSSERVLRLAVATVLGTIAVVYGVGEVVALFS
jgi:uncharacterized membrane protein YfcA